MDHNEQVSLLERIRLLQNMTEARGCHAGEADVAALKIGKLVQKYGLHVSFADEASHAERPPRQTTRPQKDTTAAPDNFFTYGDVLVIGSTEKAIMVRDEDDGEFWVPRSQLRNGCEHWMRGDDGTLCVSTWWARKEEWDNA